VSTSTRPIEPLDPNGEAGVWPRPRLSRRATALGLNRTQWGYVLAGYTVWDGGRALWGEAIRPLSLPVPWTPAGGELVWAIACLLLTAGLVGFAFHGLHAYRAWQRAWPYWGHRTPLISVWRPVSAAFDEGPVEEAEEERRERARRDHAHRAPVAEADNPLGWVVV
jgi:hypothetical protein